MKSNSYGLMSALNESFMKDIEEKRAKTLKESQNLKESISENEIVQLHQQIENASDADEIQEIIYTISDGALEDEVQRAYDQSLVDNDSLEDMKGFILSTLEDNAEYLDESQKVDSNNLTKEQLWKLRQEIVLGSLYLDDYKNSFGIDPQAACNFFDSFIEDAQQDDEGKFNDRKTEEFDNAEELYNYYLTCENPFGELKESQKLNETGEWDDSDEEMQLWLEDLRLQAEEIARNIDGEVKIVKGFDAYQGPFAIIHSPKHGDVELWYDQEDDTGRSFNAKVAHVGWLNGSVGDISLWLNQDKIPEEFIINESTESENLNKNQILNEDSLDPLELLISGDDVYFRNEADIPLVGRYANNYPQPEEYDEGFLPENGGTEEELQKAKEAYEAGDVWQFDEVHEDTLTSTGDIYAIIYGQNDLAKFINTLRYVKIVKRLEEDQIDDAREESKEKGLISEEASEPEGRKMTKAEFIKEFGAGCNVDVINAGREPEERIEIIDDSNLKESDEEIMELVQNSIKDGKLPDEIQYKGKTYKQFNVMDSDNDGETSSVYYCNMENTPSGDPQESNDYFFVKVALNKNGNGYKGVKEVRFVEDLTESGIKDKASSKLNKAKKITRLIDKAKMNEEDLVQVNAVQTEPDYVITDVTELEDTTPGDIQSPDIDAMLTMIQESIKDVYGPDSIKIHIHSSNLIENGSFALVDIQTPEILKEFEKINSKDTAVGKSLILENKNNGLFEFRVNNTTGTTRYIKRTRKPAQAIYEWLETEFLAEAKKAKEEEELIHKRKELEDTINQFLSNNKDLQLAIETIKMYIDAVGKEGKEQIQDMIEKVIVEFPVGISTTDDSLKFDSRDDVIEIIFGKQWIKEEPKEVEPSVPGTEVIKESEASVEELWKYIDSKPNLKYIKDIKDNPQEVSNMLNIEAKKDKELYRLLHKSTKLNESYQQFNIGEIEVVYNPETQEVMYSIGADDTHDKKINLTKVPSVETPYNTETIIKNYIERQYGEIPEEIENKEETQEDFPLPTEEVVTDEVIEEDAGEELENPIEQDADIPQEDQEAIEDSKSETGSAKFQKIKPNSGISVEDIREAAKEGTVQADSSYIVVEERELSDEEFNNFAEDLSQNEDFFVGVTPIDRKNYAFNVIKITNQNSTFDILADPVGYNYRKVYCNS